MRAFGLINRNCVAAAVFDQLHRRNVGHAVAEINNARKRHPPLAVFHKLVDQLVIELAQPLVDFGQVLHLGRIVDHARRPYRRPVLPKRKAAAVHVGKVFTDGRTTQNFLIPRRDDVMLDFQPQLFPVGVDAFKPPLHAFVVLDQRPAIGKILTRQLDAFFFGGLHKIVHAARNLVGAVVDRPLVGLFPKRLRAHPELRNQHVILHIGRGERFVKVIYQRDNRIFHLYLN